MRMEVRIWKVFAVLGLLSGSVVADPLDPQATGGHATTTVTGQGEPPPTGPGFVGDACPAPTLGTIGSGGFLPYDTTGLANNFGCDPACTPACGGSCSFYGGGAADGIAQFRVATSGTWTFATCGTGFDTSLALRSGDTCPGTTCVAQDDDSCNSCGAPYSASVTASLVTGTTYYIIVDGFSGSGSPGFVRVFGPCTSPADCQDGVFCNGAEVCTGGQCAPSPTPACSGTTPVCDEATDVCMPCSANPAICTDNGLFCDGPGVCLPTGACAQGGNPCAGFQACDEAGNTCIDPNPCLAWRTEGVLTGSFSPQGVNACRGGHQGDDIELSYHAGRELISYKLLTQARNLATNPQCNNGTNPPVPCRAEANGTPYSVTVALWTVQSGGACLPDAPIAGTTCTVNPGVVRPSNAGGDVVNCAPNGGMPTGVLLPDGDDDPDTGQCGVDVFLMITGTNDGAGPSIDGARDIGGTALDDEFGQTVFITEDCDTGGNPLGTYAFGAFTAPTRSDFRLTEICTVPVGPCCLVESNGDGACELISQEECQAAGGTYQGDNELATPRACDNPDSDGDGLRDQCDGCPQNGEKFGPGQCGCENPETDSDGDGTADCVDLCPQDSGKSDPGVCGCGVPDDDSDGDMTLDCLDGCPQDPNKTAPGVCGCGVSESADSDFDGYQDCIDQCPGVDDDTFAPGCLDAIPTVSEWGLVILALLLATAAKLYFGRQPIAA
ncbi:MAG: IPTL-CTERM sorting domain-containing protein [Planctomycetes bacterium]|nr:IPTL-CTERM sorting domain-containing protein [Planctomycetota bacterium]